MLVSRYPLTGLECVGNKSQEVCPYCNHGNLEREDLTHFLQRCPLYDNLRPAYMERLQEAVPRYVDLSSMDEVELTAVILDPSHVARDEVDNKLLEGITRRMCLAFHNRRAETDGTGSRYQWASHQCRAWGNRKCKQVKNVKNCIKSKLHVPTASQDGCGFS